ncbi:hypothetical protein [Escherichia coli]|nr:hypothetical protein [Escherichia coli]
MLVGFVVGNVWSDRGWQKKWAERDACRIISRGKCPICCSNN